jgi:hypothetical protein
LRIDRELHIDALQPRRGADHASRRLHVLAADRSDHVAGRQAALRHLLRIEPDAHRVVARAKQLHVADAFDARQPVLDVEHRVVAQIRHVVAAALRQEVYDHGQVGRTLDRDDAQAPYFLGQARLGLRDAVLHHLLRLVGVGAELEGDGERHQAVGGRLAAHVEHVLDAVDRFLDRRRHRLGDDLRVGARVLRAHHHRGRHDVWIFRDRQAAHGDHAAEKDQQREHAGEDRPVDEELREIHGVLSSGRITSAAAWLVRRRSSGPSAPPAARPARRGGSAAGR